MAEPPPIRRPASEPPVAAPARPPVAPGAVHTDIIVAPPPASTEEDTSSLQAPDAGELVEDILALVATESAALLAGDGTDAQLAELNVRSALASWYALHQPD